MLGTVASLLVPYFENASVAKKRSAYKGKKRRMQQQSLERSEKRLLSALFLREAGISRSCPANFRQGLIRSKLARLPNRYRLCPSQDQSALFRTPIPSDLAVEHSTRHKVLKHCFQVVISTGKTSAFPNNKNAPSRRLERTVFFLVALHVSS